MSSITSFLQAPQPNTVKVGVVGVTGAVGREMMLVMFRRGWKPSELRVRIASRLYDNVLTSFGK